MAAAILTLTNCQPKEILPETTLAEEQTFSISVTSPDTRTANSDMSTIWSADDALNIFAAPPSSTYSNLGKATIVEGAGSGRAVFTFTATFNPSAVVDWYVLYPYNSANTTPAKLNVKIGAESVVQNGYGSTAHLAGSLCPLYGFAEGSTVNEASIPVHQMSSVIEFNVNNNSGIDFKVKSVKLDATEDVVGSFVVDIIEAEPVFTSVNAGKSSTVTVSNAAGLANGSTAKVYMPVKPYKHKTASKFSVTVSLEVEGKTVSVPFNLAVSAAKATFSAGRIKPVALNVTSSMLLGSMSITSVEAKCHKADVSGQAAAVGTSVIQYRKSGASSWQSASSTVSGSTVSATLTELEDNTAYEVCVSAGSVNGPAKSFTTKEEGAQVYNMNFDLWSIKNKVHYCYPSTATDAEKVWASANENTYQYASINSAAQETSNLAVSGSGKSAVKLTSKDKVGVLFWKKFAAGSIFTGKMGTIDMSAMSATIHMGVPFTDRPDALEGYAMYQPQKITATDDDHSNLMGKTDSGHVFVLLTDWSEPFAVTPPNTLIDFTGDSKIIGYGKVDFDSNMTSYKKFRINIEYRNDRTPKYVVICGASSALGDYFTGGDGSVLYLDEFKFIYE